MSATAPDPAPLHRALQRTHWSVLLTLVACAAFAFAQQAGLEPPPDRTLTVVGVCLALATMGVRRLGSSKRMPPSAQVATLLASYALAVVLGLLGAYLAARLGARQMGLGFTAAAAILCLRPPGRLPAS